MIAVDEQLRDLITQVCRYEKASPERQKALNRLLIAIAQLPGIYRSSHQDYPEAFNRTLEWVSKNIDRFERRSPDVQRSFVTWINGYLKWRIRDLYDPDNKYDSRRIYPTSNDDGESIDPIENLPDPKFSLSLLDLKIAQMQQAKRQRHGEAIAQYIEQDPEGVLTNRHPRKHPQCHCQLLAVRLLLVQPPQRIADVARELNINNQTLYSHWKQKCLPLLQEIGQSILDYSRQP
ncbi:MAG: hypothetical protein AB4426_33365 [Xenococcaceae cyanobacterium]